jgi:hypothetical protein
MNHIEVGHYESWAATHKSPFELWAERVEKLLGHDLDGNQDTDGYSLDYALDQFNSGMSAERYARAVKCGTTL